MKLLILNGPNLNLLGSREPAIYGSESYDALCQQIQRHAAAIGCTVALLQSNHEGALIDAIQGAQGVYGGIVINPGAYTHTSIALHDAIKGTAIPLLELHISNVHARESFRHHSYISPVARAVVCGLGVAGYPLAIEAVAQW